MEALQQHCHVENMGKSVGERGNCCWSLEDHVVPRFPLSIRRGSCSNCSQSMSTGRNSLSKPHEAEQRNSQHSDDAVMPHAKCLHHLRAVSRPPSQAVGRNSLPNYLAEPSTYRSHLLSFLHTSLLSVSPTRIHHAYSAWVFVVAALTPLARFHLRCSFWCLFAPVLLRKGAP